MELMELARTIQSPTHQEYNALQEAYDYFNVALFNGQLPACMITLQRHKGAYGYFSPLRFSSRVGIEFTDEIALNPAEFIGRTDMQILSTLVHEMVHLYQAHFGQPGRGRYHNTQWAEKMIEVGLMPTDTGSPGGKKTGQRMTHYIIPNGQFAKAAKTLFARGFVLRWQSHEGWVGKRPLNAPEAPPQPPPVSKMKFTCVTCGQNAWAKPSAYLVCGKCLLTRSEPGAPVVLMTLVYPPS